MSCWDTKKHCRCHDVTCPAPIILSNSNDDLPLLGNLKEKVVYPCKYTLTSLDIESMRISLKLFVNRPRKQSVDHHEESIATSIFQPGKQSHPIVKPSILQSSKKLDPEPYTLNVKPICDVKLNCKRSGWCDLFNRSCLMKVDAKEYVKPFLATCRYH